MRHPSRRVGTADFPYHDACSAEAEERRSRVTDGDGVVYAMLNQEFVADIAP
jgi:hypothetical protein